MQDNKMITVREEVVAYRSSLVFLNVREEVILSGEGNPSSASWVGGGGRLAIFPLPWSHITASTFISTFSGSELP